MFHVSIGRVGGVFDFQKGVASFLNEGSAPWGSIDFDGVGGFEKNRDMWEPSHAPPLWETLLSNTPSNMSTSF